VQAAGELVILVREFAARVQLGENHLDARQLFLGVLVHRHAAPVVSDLERTVLVDGYLDLLAVPCKRLVNAVVDDLVREMIGPGRVGVHARPPAHRFQPAQDFDVRGVVGFCHYVKLPSEFTPGILA
jgi:hypothetical protein